MGNPFKMPALSWRKPPAAGNLARPSELDLMGMRLGTAKSRLYENYLIHYERMLRSFQGKPITLLEIGIHKGASLKLWEQYLPLAQIVGVDIEPATRKFAGGRVQVEIGSQADAVFLGVLAGKYQPDIVIDDGSHIEEHQIFTFQQLFAAVKPGGLYVVEDISAGTPSKTVDFFSDLQRNVLQRARKSGFAGVPGKGIPDGISHVEIVPGLAAVWKGATDALDRDHRRLEAVVREANNHESLFYLSQYLHRNGGAPQHALDVARDALAADPRNPWINYEICLILAEMGEKPGALQALNAALEAAPSPRALDLFKKQLERLSTR